MVQNVWERAVILKEGTIDILLMLDKKPRSFNELKKIKHSPNTILRRLREAQKGNLVKSQLFSTNRGKKPIIRYVLTPKGKELLTHFIPVKRDYLEITKTIKELGEKIKKQKKELKLLLSSVELRK